MSSPDRDLEVAVQFSRRSLWFAMLMVILLAAAALQVLLAPGTGRPLMLALPFIGIFGCIALAARRSLTPKAAAEMRALQSDELRQHSLNKANRNGFITMLAAQPVLAVATLDVASGSVGAVMATATVAAGALVAIGSVLWHDR